MNKKAQALMISLWILIILTTLTVGTGHQVSLGLRLSRFHRDKLKSYCLARAGLILAMDALEQDQNAFDSLNEEWSNGLDPATNKPFFKNREMKEGTGGTFTVEYSQEPYAGQCMVDEERKININTAAQEELIALLDSAGASNSQALVYNIRAYRGDTDPDIPEGAFDYQGLGFDCKKAKFTNPEELMLVKDMDAETFLSIRKLFTVWGSGQVNINTVSQDTLKIICRGIAKQISIGENFADGLADKLISQRNGAIAFKAITDINIDLTGSEETNLFNELMKRVVLTSENFTIEVRGNASKISSRIRAVYDRKNKKIIGWHQG